MQKVNGEEEGWLKWAVKLFQIIEMTLNIIVQTNSNLIFSKSHNNKSNFSNWIIMNHQMKFQEPQEEMFIFEGVIVNISQHQGTILETVPHKDIATINNCKKRKRKKEHWKEEVQQRMFKRCWKMRHSEIMIWARPEREEKLTEWQCRMMILFRTKKRSHNLVPAPILILEEDKKHIIIEQEGDEVDQDVWLFPK